MDRNGYNASILQGFEKYCYLTNSTNCGLVRHEIYYGLKNRNIAKKNGFWVYLIPAIHNMRKDSVHQNKELDLRLKRECQKKFEEMHTRDEFIALIGKSYLE